MLWNMSTIVHYCEKSNVFITSCNLILLRTPNKKVTFSTRDENGWLFTPNEHQYINLGNCILSLVPLIEQEKATNIVIFDEISKKDFSSTWLTKIHLIINKIIVFFSFARMVSTGSTSILYVTLQSLIGLSFLMI